MHLPDVLADPDYERTESQRLGGFRTILGVPMLSEDEVIGVISLWRRNVDPFAVREIEVATTFAAQGAIAIRNANLMQELELRTRELARSVDELEGLRHVGEAVSSSLDLHEVLSTIVTHAVQLSGAEGGSIFEIDDEAEAFEVRAAFGTSDDLLAALRATDRSSGNARRSCRLDAHARRGRGPRRGFTRPSLGGARPGGLAVDARRTTGA